METEATRALIRRFVDARNSNDREAISSMLSADAQWVMPVGAGMGPFAPRDTVINGRDAVAAALTGGSAGKILDVSTMKRTVHQVIVDGDTGVVLQRLSAKTLGGADYDNEYCWVYACADGVVHR